MLVIGLPFHEADSLRLVVQSLMAIRLMVMKQTVIRLMGRRLVAMRHQITMLLFTRLVIMGSKAMRSIHIEGHGATGHETDAHRCIVMRSLP